MLYAGLDLSRQRLDVHVLDEQGQTVEVTAVRPDADALRTLVERTSRQGQEVSAVIESMTGARFVHDTLERYGWDVAIADAVKAKGLAPLAAKSAWNGRLLRQQDRGRPRAVEGATGSLKGADRVQRASGR
jgi:transposase